MRTYYDALFSDIEGTKQYEIFLKKHIVGTNVLELACGTGDLLNLLSEHYNVYGLDLAPTMLETCIQKYPHLKERVTIGNFLNYTSDMRYDSLICVGDSLNYMEDETEMDAFVKTASSLSDTVIVDFHHPYRLIEFASEYYEEGSTENFDYQYVIQVHENNLVHTINFLDGSYDTVVQWVFKPEMLIEKFESFGYIPSVYTDFDIPGIVTEGEKIMIVFRRGT